MKAYSVTFDVVTPESAEHADFAETGFERELSPLCDDDEDAIQAAVTVIERWCGHVEASSSDIDAHTWFTQADGEVDYSDASETRHSVHFEGFTDTEMQAVAAELTVRGLL